MKYCAECGTKTELETAKFCPNCGTSLLMNLETGDPSETSPSREREMGNSYSLGVKLEEVVQSVLENTGYQVSRRVRVAGKGGNTHEVNLIATRDTETLAVECKNCGEGKTVGIKELRDFHGKLRDLRDIKNSMYITNTTFSRESEIFATENNIKLWDGDKLSKLFFSMNIGRFGPPKRKEEKKEVVIDMALPLKVTYEKAISVDVANPSALVLQEASLIFSPFYLFEFKIDFERTDRSGRNHRVRNEGNYVVDAQNGKIVSATPMPVSKIYLPEIFSKTNRTNPYALETASDLEENYIVTDLSTIKPLHGYRVEWDDTKFRVIIKDPKVSQKAAHDMVMDEIIEDNTQEISYDVKKSKNKKEQRAMTIIPKHGDIRFRQSSLIYVPKWKVNFKAKDITYTRQILAASGTVVMNELSLCPKHFIAWKPWDWKKSVYAICTLCGFGYCEGHLKKINDSFICLEHSKS